MSKILAVKPITTKAGKPVVLVTTFDGSEIKDHWCPFGSWKAKNLSTTAFDAYVGGEFQADYFQEGEILLSGDPVTQSDIILRDFTASMNTAVSASIAALEAKTKSESMSEAAAMFRARRVANLAAAQKPAETPVPVAAVAGPVEA